MKLCFISSSMGRGRIRSREFGAVIGETVGGWRLREDAPGTPSIYEERTARGNPPSIV
jgi:hypothetical protein